MNIINKNGKIFGLINVIDFFVLLIVVVIAMGTYYKFVVLDKTSSTVAMEPISYTVEVKRVRDFIFSNVKEGDILFDKTSGNSIGKIVKVEATPAIDSLSTIDGSYKTVEVENRYDVVFTIEAEGTITDGGYFVNKTYELVVGSSKKFMTKYFEFDGKVKEIL